MALTPFVIGGSFGAPMIVLGDMGSGTEILSLTSMSPPEFLNLVRVLARAMAHQANSSWPAKNVSHFG